ncbi:MAG TPA: FAD-dependent oxidoreductase [Bryobacteraceae bacterium]|nr:FAD-dependent oxidoreductase [Bryobacteraceae bacterium]
MPAPGSPHSKPHIAVIGAGAFGGWTALYLLRGGARVTLLDAWGPGNSRASSGGETRIIRAIYGPNDKYTRLAAHALALWKENEARWKQHLFHHSGMLWMVVAAEDAYEQAALAVLRDADLGFDELSPADGRRRFPQINWDGVRWAIFENDAGFLPARRSCRMVLESFLAEGGEYRQLAVTPGEISSGHMRDISLSDGSKLSADQYVFACGPWLGKVFPDVIGAMIRPTRQEVFFFGVPAGDARFSEPDMPVWIEHGPAHYFYGIPGNEDRGFKIADDNRGAAFDPTSGDRTPSADAIQLVREHLDHRFPGLRGAPLLEARVCQYENTPDENFIMDRHPAATNVWIVGGGSGHGFKHGPAVGVMAAELVLGKRAVDPVFALARFQQGVEAGRVH